MKHLVPALLLVLSTTAVVRAEQLFPAGSIVTCTVAEGKISSKTTAIGDPVLCTLNPVEKYGRSVFPYGSYIEGRFEDYRDPGHFVGKGWMELKFDRLYVGNRVYPISAKVVSTPKYNVDRDGRILGNGHPVKDTVEWLIPVLWPIDLINLPRRGPRPVLTPETRLTLELMDDLGVPDYDQPVRQQAAALIERPQAPTGPSVPQQVIYQNFQSAPAPQQQVAYQPPSQPQVVYQQAPPTTVVVQQSPAPVVYRYRYMPPPPPVVYPYGYGYGYPMPY